MSQAGSPPLTGRHAATAALIDAAAHFPDLAATVGPDPTSLAPNEAALAVAIHRTVLQRWMTLEHVLNRYLNQPCAKLEPAMRAVLLAGAAQLLFMQRLPAYAVVDETVTLAQRLVRPKARGLTNAVLRKVANLVEGVHAGEPWQPAPDALPLDEGTLRLTEPVLPAWPGGADLTDLTDLDALAEHLSLATSHPAWLVRRWLESYEPGAVMEACRTGVCAPPTIVAVEAGFDFQVQHDDWQAHEAPGYVVWQGGAAALVRFLQQHPHRRVQDPAAGRAVAATRALNLKGLTILDYCAGRGTKTIQLAATHPDAEIMAADPDPQRATSLRQVAERFENVRVVEPEEALAARVNLLLLDVPCSNTGVLGRRPEARYRLNAKRLRQLVALQQQIVTQALQTVRPDGYVLYSTCSIEPEENDQQARWIEEQTGSELQRESLTLPTGSGAHHHDGSYHALVRVRDEA